MANRFQTELTDCVPFNPLNIVHNPDNSAVLGINAGLTLSSCIWQHIFCIFSRCEMYLDAHRVFYVIFPLFWNNYTAK